MTTAQDRTAAELWALGDYDRVGALIADQGRALVAAAGIGPGLRVLDVGAGSGYAGLTAAAAGAEVVATDVTPDLLAVGERRARARGLTLRWEVADAQALPYPDGAFDVMLSCIGAMFAPDPGAAARELMRVCRPGGTVAMANWTPDGAAGRLFRLIGRFAPPPAGPPPTTWGDPAEVTALLAGADVHTEPRRVRLAFDGPAAVLAAHYLRFFPPLVALVDGLDPTRAALLERELTAFFAALDTGPAGGPARYAYEYLLVRARKPLRPRPGRPRAAAR